MRAKPLESPESSSPIVTRSVSAGLKGRYCDPYQFADWQRFSLNLLGRFPQQVARFVISRFEKLAALDPAMIKKINLEDLISERLSDYADLGTKFPCITIGSSLGGASAHLALALGGPFLPQPFVLTLRGGSPDGNVLRYYQHAAKLAKQITESNPGILAIQHYDPVHDEWMTRYVNHLRLKLLSLPNSYARFIENYLIDGGAVCYLDCQARWLRYRTSERTFFQVGGWGDITPEEYIYGSGRLTDYCRKMGLIHGNWQLPDFPLEIGPESEWGSEPEMLLKVQDFCYRKGFQFIHIQMNDPDDFSRLAYRSVELLLAKEGRKASGTLIEMFSQFDATAVQLSGLLPLWLVFNTHRSRDFLISMLPTFDPDLPVFFSPLITFTPTPDIVSWSGWEDCLSGFNWINLGARKSHYPADALRLTSWSKPLRDWVNLNQRPLRTVLTGEELISLV